MYICTITLTKQNYPTCGVFETKVTHTWNDQSQLTFTNERLTITMNTQQLPYRDWIPLLTNAIVQVKAIFFNTIGPETFLGLRLYKNQEFFSQDYSTSSIRFLRHEATLLNILKNCDTFIEPIERKRYKVEMQTDDVIPLHDNIGLSLMPPKITTRKANKLTGFANPIVVAHRHANRCNTTLSMAMHDLPRNGKVCILSRSPKEWLDECIKMNLMATEVTESISYEDYTHAVVYVISYDSMPFQFLDYDHVMESFKEMIKVVMVSTPTDDQVRRFLRDRFHTKFRSSLLPLFVHWSSLVLDNVDTHYRDIFEYENIFYTQVTEDIVPRLPAFEDLEERWSMTPQQVRMLMPQWMKYIHFLEVPKYITRRIKFRIEKVKFTTSEQRLFDLFGSMRNIYPNVPMCHSLLRLGAVPMPVERMRTVFRLIQEQQLPTVASILQENPKYVPVDKALQDLGQETSCLVCFDKCESYSLSVCGHTFCKDCSLQLFSSINKHIQQTTACPYCRETLHAGDVFLMVPDAPVIDIVPAKQSIIDQNKSYTVYTGGDITDDKLILTELLTDFKDISNKFIDYVATTGKPLKVVFITTIQEKWVEKFMAFMNL